MTPKPTRHPKSFPKNKLFYKRPRLWIFVGFFGVVGLLTLWHSLAASSSFTPTGMRPLPDPLYGVTITDGINGADSSTVKRINDSAKALAANNGGRLPTARFVFDEFTKATDYTTAVNQVQPYSYIMGELLDSQYVNLYSPQAYYNRTTEFLNGFKDKVDLWEVGNEVNGEWLGTTPDVVAKISNAYGQVKTAGKRAAITLYYNPSCWDKQDHEMLTWTKANIPANMKSGLDYVFISYYEQDCNNYRPSATTITSVFNNLHAIFPNARLGFGELGLGNGALASTNPTKAKDILKYYYGLKPAVPNYVYGGFWWNYYQDMTPYSSTSPKPMWTALITAFVNINGTSKRSATISAP
jgi:hypothetical protein